MTTIGLLLHETCLQGCCCLHQCEALLLFVQASSGGLSLRCKSMKDRLRVQL